MISNIFYLFGIPGLDLPPQTCAEIVRNPTPAPRRPLFLQVTSVNTNTLRLGLEYTRPRRVNAVLTRRLW